jgi:hypothetical protein
MYRIQHLQKKTKHSKDEVVTTEVVLFCVVVMEQRKGDVGRKEMAQKHRLNPQDAFDQRRMEKNDENVSHTIHQERLSQQKQQQKRP